MSDTELDCIDGPEQGNDCSGPVHLRMALSGTGTPYPRCDAHWNRRLELEARLRADYPDMPTPPAWFDPLNAGEHWNDDY